MVRLTYAPDLVALRAEAAARVDAEAEKVRGLFVTLGSGQAMVYQEKRVEAELVLGAEAEPAAQLIPHIAAEAAASGVSVREKAEEIMAVSRQWTQVSSVIEEIRLAAKAAIAAAKSPDAIAAAAEADWSRAESMR